MATPIPAFEGLANSLLTFVNYGITIVFIMIVVEAYRMITFKAPGGASAAGLAKSLTWDTIKGKWGRAQAKTKTRLLNEYVEEQKATGLLDEARGAAQDALREVQDVKGRTEITLTQRDDVIKSVMTLKDKLNDARREYRRVTKTTWRQERQMGPILEKLKEDGKDVSKLVASENNILKFHKDIVDAVDKTLAQFDKMKKQLEKIENERTLNFPMTLTGSALEAPLDQVEKNLDDTIYKLEEAYKKQLEVDKDVQGIISLTRQLWTV